MQSGSSAPAEFVCVCCVSCTVVAMLLIIVKCFAVNDLGTALILKLFIHMNRSSLKESTAGGGAVGEKRAKFVSEDANAAI